MRFKKLVAAISAAAMLGTLAAAVPASADEASMAAVYPDSAVWLRVNSSGINGSNYAVLDVTDRTTDGTGSDYLKEMEWIKTGDSSNSFVGFGAVYKFNVKNYSNYNISDVTLTMSDTAFSVYVYDELPENNAADGQALYNFMQPNGVEGDYLTTHPTALVSGASNRIVSVSWNDLTAKADSDGNVYLFFTRALSGVWKAKVQYDQTPYLTVKYTEKPTATGVTITSDATKTLYKDDTVKFTTTVEPEGAAEPTLSFSAEKTDGSAVDCTSYFTDNGDGSYTYNNAGRPGKDTKVTVTAASGNVSGTTTINVQRLRHISYNITDKTGEAESPTMNVAAAVNGTQAYSESVTYGSEQKGSVNSYSGHSDYEMTFTVPDGYKLSITSPTDTSKYSITTTDSTVTIKNTTDIDNDFPVTGTLEKKTDSDYRTADGTISATGDVAGVNVGDQYWTFTTTDADKTAVKFKNSAGSEKSVKVNFGTQVTASEVVFSIIVSGSANETGLQAKLSTVE